MVNNNNFMLIRKASLVWKHTGDVFIIIILKMIGLNEKIVLRLFLKKIVQ